MKIYNTALYFLLIVIPTFITFTENVQASENISVNGNRLEKNGVEWIPLGFTFDAFVAPLESLNGCKFCEKKIKDEITQVESARKHFSLDSIIKAKSLGSNIIRLQISQPGLDPKSKIYSDEYRNNLENAISTIRKADLIVMLSMTYNSWSGLSHQEPFPNESTFRAWSTIKASISGDKGVILEVFNEPYGGSDKWEKWRASHQELIKKLREELNFKNVLVINGLRLGRLYKGVPQLIDPLDQLAYGVHPYLGGFGKNDNEPEWMEKWGWMKNNKALIVTEWNALGKWQCGSRLVKRTDALYNFIMKNKLGMIGWAFDIEGTIFDDKGIPTDFEKLTCGSFSKNGGGKLILKTIAAGK